MSPFDNEIVERAARAFELSDYQVLHPSMMFLVCLQKDRASSGCRTCCGMRDSRSRRAAASTDCPRHM